MKVLAKGVFIGAHMETFLNKKGDTIEYQVIHFEPENDQPWKLTALRDLSFDGIPKYTPCDLLLDLSVDRYTKKLKAKVVDVL